MPIPILDPAERRTWTAPVELRVDDDGAEPPKIVGHAAVFDRMSLPLMGGAFREKVAAGAFSKVLRKKPDVRALFNHDPNFVIARAKSKTLKLKEDDEGLLVEMDPPDAQWMKDLMQSMKRGDIDAMSFAFTVKRDEWLDVGDGTQVRTILEIGDLFDVSVVTTPAYPDARVKLRGLDLARAAHEALDELAAELRGGLELPPDHLILIRASLAALGESLPPPEPAAGDPPAPDGWRVASASRARTLRLIEIGR